MPSARLAGNDSSTRIKLYDRTPPCDLEVLLCLEHPVLQIDTNISYSLLAKGVVVASYLGRKIQRRRYPSSPSLDISAAVRWLGTQTK